MMPAADGVRATNREKTGGRFEDGEFPSAVAAGPVAEVATNVCREEAF
jgi:hypothetical protein